MSATYVKQLKLAEELKDIVLCFRPMLGDPGDPITERFLNPECQEYFWAASEQVSLYPVQSKTQQEILNEDGKELYRAVKEACENTEPKMTFKIYGVCPTESGNWFANTSSKYWKPDFGKMAIHSFQNMCILGKTVDNTWVQTSPCIFINSEEGWCFTQSGSYYKLEQGINFIDCHQMMSNDIKDKSLV